MGPTAAGKTDFAIQLAKQYNTSVVSADSRQIYREMRIATARPHETDLQGVPHYFLGSGSMHDPYTAGRFAREALEVIQNLHKTNRVVVVAGGTFLYIRALCEGFNEFPEVDDSIAEQLEKDLHTKGIAYLQAQLQKLDPDYARTIDIHNPRRLLRALSVIQVSGKPFSHFLQPVDFQPPFQPVYLGLLPDRTQLYQNIDRRVDQMMQNGLLAEAKQLYPFRHLRPLQTVGYAELFDYMDGTYSLEEAVSKIKQHTRNYAKRQFTWLRGMDNLQLVEAHELFNLSLE